MHLRALASSTFVLTIAALGSACQANQYPNCGAFEYGDLQQPPRLVDEDASPVDCGRLRVVGTMGAHVIEGSMALDCALDNIAEGHAMQVELDEQPTDAWGRSAAIFSDEDGLAMRWQSANMDLSTALEARVYQLDTGRVDGCRDLEDAGERFDCLTEAVEAAELVKTCKTGEIQSI